MGTNITKECITSTFRVKWSIGNHQQDYVVSTQKTTVHFNPEDGGATLLQNIGNHQQHMASESTKYITPSFHVKDVITVNILTLYEFLFPKVFCKFQR